VETLCAAENEVGAVVSAGRRCLFANITHSVSVDTVTRQKTILFSDVTASFCGIAADVERCTVYVSDTSSHRIRRVTGLPSELFARANTAAETATTDS
jgi:hypothetical protein